MQLKRNLKFIKERCDYLKHSAENFEAIYTVLCAADRRMTFCETVGENGRCVSHTYGDLIKAIDEVCQGACELYPQDSVVGVYLDNSMEYVAVFFGLLKAGITPFLCSTRLSDELTLSLLEETGAVALITDKESLCGTHPLSLHKRYENTNRRFSDRIIFSTSGTTARPKLVVHCGKPFCRAISNTYDSVYMPDREIGYNKRLQVVIFSFLPLYHVFGLTADLFWFVIFGAKFIYIPKGDPSRIALYAKRFRVTNFNAVPMVFERMVEMVKREAERTGKLQKLQKAAKFSLALQRISPCFGRFIARNVLFKSVRKRALGTRMKYLISGGGALNAEAYDYMNALGYCVHIGYGLTECGVLCVNTQSNIKNRKPDSCGKIFPNVDYKLTEDGLLLVGKDNCFIGTYSEGKFIPNDNEYHNTGDKVRMRGRELHVIGRVDGVLVTRGGENISPVQVEHKIECGDAQKMIAAYENSCVLIIDGTEFSKSKKAALFASISELPMHERPVHVFLTAEALPTNAKGVNRRIVQGDLDDGRLIYTELTNDISDKKGTGKYIDVACEIFADVCNLPRESVNADTDFIRDIGGDSMTYVELIDKMSERLGMDVAIERDAPLTPREFSDIAEEVLP